MSNEKKTYSLNDVQRMGLLIKKDKKPFKNIKAIRHRVNCFGIVPTKTNDKGVLTFEITEEDLEKMNTYE